MMIVESGISARLAPTEGEYRHAALAEAISSVNWDEADCPSAAVPGLSFGVAEASKALARGAHRAAGLR
jgi:hypothetical protein